MPRITAPTVAQHRAARERALLDAAHELLTETGEAPSLSRVAERAGLGRTTMYQYFASRQELLRAMVRDVFPRWTARISDAMDRAPTEADRLMAYAVANVSLAALAPGEELDEQAARMHREVQEPLVRTLERLEVDAPAEVAELVNAVVHGATLLLESGRDLDAALRHLQAVLGPMVREHGGRGTVA